MSVIQINVGANPNDGTGDALRTAMQTCNTNFASLDKSQKIIGIFNNFNVPAVSGTIVIASIEIPANSITNCLSWEAQFYSPIATVTGTDINIFLNNSNSTLGATLIGKMTTNVGNYYTPMDRTYSLLNTLISGTNFTSGSTSSRIAKNTPPSFATFNTTQTHYILIQAITTGTDRLFCPLFKITT